MRTRKVTMVGAYNNSDAADARAYSAMVTVALPDLYDDVQKVFQQSAKDRKPPGNPQRRASGEGWDAYFMPSLPITRDNDPVMDRLRAIPGRPGTRMTSRCTPGRATAAPGWPASWPGWWREAPG